MTSNTKIMDILVATETVADQISVNKQEIIALDNRRQQTREAIREIGKSDEQKIWITIGSMLVKSGRVKALELLKKDQNQIEIEINKLRSDQKILVNKLRDLEHSPQLKGFDLKPLNSTEVNAFKSNLPNF